MGGGGSSFPAAVATKLFSVRGEERSVSGADDGMYESDGSVMAILDLRDGSASSP
jgi:hypothetical protein